MFHKNSPTLSQAENRFYFCSVIVGFSVDTGLDATYLSIHPTLLPAFCVIILHFHSSRLLEVLLFISKSLQINWQISFTSQENLCPSVFPLHAGLFFNLMVVLLRGYQCILAPANLLCFMYVSVLYQCWSVFSLELLISFQKYIPYIQLGTLKKSLLSAGLWSHLEEGSYSAE